MPPRSTTWRFKFSRNCRHRCGDRALALSDWPRKLNGFAESLEFLIARGINRSFDDLVAQLATVTARPQLRAMIRGWVESLPLPETIPAARIGNACRLDTSKEIRSLARTWRNCLDSYTEDIDAGSCAVYLRACGQLSNA